MQKVFFDTEFSGLSQDTQLLSIGLVHENGETFYAEVTDYDENALSAWVKENVIPKMLLEKEGYAINEHTHENGNFVLRGAKHIVARELANWLQSFGSQIIMVADVLAYDWVLFCDLWGTAFAIPQNVFYIPVDLSTLLLAKDYDPDISRVDLVKQFTPSGELDNIDSHNALTDAQMCKIIYENIM